MLAHLSICILPREGPCDAAAFSVAALLPSGDFGGQQRAGRQAAGEALAVKDADLDLCHVEPAGVFRGAVEDDAAQQVPRCVDAQHVLEAHAKVGAQVVEDQMNSPRLWVDVFKQVLDERNEVGLGTAIGHRDRPPSALRFHRHEQIAGAGAGGFVVMFRWRPRLQRQGSAGIAQQLLAVLVDADDWLPALDRSGIECEQVVHSLSVLRGQSTNAPHQLAPGLDAVFLAAGGWSPG